MRALSLVACLFLSTSFCAAQTRLEEGGHELQVWAGGGHSVSGGTSSTGVFNVGLRYGWILTAPHGPGFLKGRLNTRWTRFPHLWFSSRPTRPMASVLIRWALNGTSPPARPSWPTSSGRRNIIYNSHSPRWHLERELYIQRCVRSTFSA